MNKDERFRQLYAEHSSEIRKMLYHLAGPHQVDDLVQETFVKVWRYMDGFQGLSSWRTWIYRIAVNTAQDVLRRPSIKIAAGLPETHFENISGNQSATSDLKDLIRKGTERLSENLRPCFVLFYYQGLSVTEIAESLEIPEGTVKTRLHHAREKFIGFLRENGVDHEF